METSEQELNTTLSKQTTLNKSSCSCNNWDYTELVNVNENFTVQIVGKKPCGILEVEHIITQVYSESTYAHDIH